MPCESCPLHSFSDTYTGASALSNCTCLGGYFRNTIRNCSACVAGKYKLAGHGQCELCQAGSFSAMQASSSCSTCRSNAASLPGSSGCKCIEGYTRLSFACVMCEDSTWKDSISNDACFACPQHTVSQHGSTSLNNCSCKSGYSGLSDGAECEPCTAGYAKASSGPGHCMKCPAGAYTLERNASTDCILCSAGKFSTNPGLYFRGNDGGTRMSCVGASQTCPCHVSSVESSGILSDGFGEYSHGSKCEWHITAPSDIQLNVTMLDTEFGSDYFTVWSCSTASCESSTELARLSGNVASGAASGGTTFISTSGFMRVTFTSDVSGPLGQGFEASWHVTSTLHHPTQACTACPAASTTTSPGATHVNNCSCAPGYFPTTSTVESGFNRTSAVCLPCPRGSYQSVLGFSSCSVCAAGKSSNVTAAPACEDCTYGTYADTTGSFKCVSCPWDHISSPLGSTRVENCSCSPGHRGETASSCMPCGPGQYKNFIGLGVMALNGSNTVRLCSQCEAGKYNSEFAQTNCSQCPRNTFSRDIGAIDSSACKACPTNSQSPESSSIRYNCTCNAGFTSDGGVIWGPDMTLFACRACAVGTFKDWTGQDICKECPKHASSLAAAPRLVDCTCIPGYFGANGTDCEACKPASFKPAAGPQLCSLCGQGKYASAVGATSESVCIKCPTNMTTLAEGTQVKANCMCQAGYQRLFVGGECVPCLAGMYKVNVGDHNCVQCSAGSYAPVIASVACVKCAFATYLGATGASSSSQCVPCLPNTNSAEGSTLANHCLCNKGYSGADAGPCIACTRGTYKQINGSSPCTACPADTYSDAFAAISAHTCLNCTQNSLAPSGSRDKMQVRVYMCKQVYIYVFRLFGRD